MTGRHCHIWALAGVLMGEHPHRPEENDMARAPRIPAKKVTGPFGALVEAKADFSAPWRHDTL